MNLFILGSPNYKVATRYNVLGTLSFSSVNMLFCCDVSVSGKVFHWMSKLFLEPRVYQAMQSHEARIHNIQTAPCPKPNVLNEALVIQELPVGNGVLDTGYEYVTAAEGYSTVCVYILVHHLLWSHYFRQYTRLVWAPDSLELRLFVDMSLVGTKAVAALNYHRI